MTDEDKLKFAVCMHIGCPHPRILDAILTHGDLIGWHEFLTWYYRKPDNG